MSPHISYHPLGNDTISRYLSYMSSQEPAALAAVHYDGAGAHDRFRQPFVDMAGQAQTLSGVFDTSHGLHLAVTQGFFGRFHYLHDARLSAMTALLASYRCTWQDLLPSWPATDSARNQLGDEPSSGVFLAAEHVELFMNDAHSEPTLQEALAREFPGEKLQVLWDALTDAHQTGCGLLEASGVIEPDPHNIAQSQCRTNQTNCDPAGLRLFLAAPPAPVPTSGIEVTSAETGTGTGRKMPGAPSLAERMRQRAESPPPSDF